MCVASGLLQDMLIWITVIMSHNFVYMCLPKNYFDKISKLGKEGQRSKSTSYDFGHTK